ncbi:MAG: o-succinylbenzoate synthase [Haloarculaceae archaeon]
MIEPFSLPLSSPLDTASGAVDRREGFLVMYDHRGVTGVGESTVLPGWTESLDECREALDRALAVGTDDRHSEALLTMDADEVPAARHGFATALVDADARADGVPLYRWFDGDSRVRRVPVNATVGDDDVEGTVTAAETAVTAGFDCLKLKVGARELDADVARLRAIREAVGPDVTLRADANGVWDRETARLAVEKFAALDVAYVEQPLAAEDLSGLADLRGGPVDVAVDESLVEHRVADVLDADAADVLICKPMVLGGPGNAHTLAMRARDLGVEPVVTTTIDAVVARTAAVHVAGAIPDVRPCGLATADLLAADLGPDPAPVADGSVAVPQDPGLGVTFEDLEGPR